VGTGMTAYFFWKAYWEGGSRLSVISRQPGRRTDRHPAPKAQSL